MTHQPEPPMTRRERRNLERRDRPLKDRSRASTRRPPKRPAWQSPFLLVSLAALAVAVVIIVLNWKPTSSGDSSELFIPPTSYANDVVEGDLLGKPDAPVLMEVWSDFQCPVCGRLVREEYPTLKAQFVDTGLLRIQARDIAFLSRSSSRDESLELATGALCAAQQDAYWPFHDYIFWNQRRENAGDYSESYLAGIADRLGLDRTAWDACMSGDDVRNAMRSATQVALGAGVNATPTIALNGGPRTAGLPKLNELVAQIQALVNAGGGSPSPTAVP